MFAGGGTGGVIAALCGPLLRRLTAAPVKRGIAVPIDGAMAAQGMLGGGMLGVPAPPHGMLGVQAPPHGMLGVLVPLGM